MNTATLERISQYLERTTFERAAARSRPDVQYERPRKQCPGSLDFAEANESLCATCMLGLSALARDAARREAVPA